MLRRGKRRRPSRHQAGIGAVALGVVGVIATAAWTDRGDASSSPVEVMTAPPATATSVVSEPPTERAGTLPPLALADEPAVVARPIPSEPPPTILSLHFDPPPWAASTRITPVGHLATEVGCARDLSAASLDAFFAERVGPVLGWDYQHVYPLGGDRYLWLFQDTFIDHSGLAGHLGFTAFVHNSALVQDGRCFTLLHRGTPERPQAFEPGHGRGSVLTRWFWPMGGELVDGQLHVFWVEMVKDGYDPAPPDGLGWHPERLWLGTYDPRTLARTGFTLATDPGVAPIYGYAVASDATHTYLFGNTFEQNLLREGGFWNGPHSASRMWLARVPRGQLLAMPEYRTSDGWSPHRADAESIISRYYVENPMQPRLMDGRWVSATAVDGYWGDHLAIDVAPDPWGPWTTVEYRHLLPRGFDPLRNTYHAHLLPWWGPGGSLVVSVSNNARNMVRDAWPFPERYRPMVITLAPPPWPPAPTVPPPPSEPVTTEATTTTTTTANLSTSSTTSTTSTTSPATTTTTSTTTTTTDLSTTTTTTTDP